MIMPEYCTTLTGHRLVSVSATEVTEIPVRLDCRETEET